MRLPIVKQDGTEFENAEELSKLIQDAGDDLYLLTTQTWHGGIHISEDSAPWAKDTYPVRCIADGEVVAYRMMEDYLTSEFKGEALQYSNSFCLVRHHYEQEDDKGQKQGFTYYSLYMHLCPWKQWPSTERYRLNQRRNVRNSVPQNGQQAPAVTLPVGETFEPVEGEAIQQGQINGVAYDFMRIRMLSEGVSNSQVLATKGTDTLWIAKDEAVMEQISVSRPNWIYDQVEATVKEKMNGRADPKPNKGQTGFKLAGDPAHSISAGTKIRFDAHRVQFQEIGGKARKMARCELPESGRSQWVCIEEQYIDIISETPTQLDKLYELPSPVPIRAGDTIGYLGLYESPASLEGGKTGNTMIHLEVFSPEDDVVAVVNSKKWQDEGFRLVNGSDCDGFLDPENVPEFFQSLCSSNDESNTEILAAETVREKLKDKASASERHKTVAKHRSEWSRDFSQPVFSRFLQLFSSSASQSLIDHEKERAHQLSWISETSKLGIPTASVWHFYPLILESQSGSGNAKTMTNMVLSEKGEKLLKSVESLRLRPYDDQTSQTITSWVKGATVGYGHLISRSEWRLYKNGITSEQADTLFKADVAPFIKAVNDHTTAQLTQNQFDAAVMLAYNIGIASFSSSSAVAIINNPNASTPYQDLESAWKAWNRSQGSVSQGLINRRNAEWDVYSSAVYKRW